MSSESTPDRVAFSVEDIVKAVGIARSTVYEEITAGRLRSKRIGRRRVVLVDDLHAWLEELPDGC